MSAAAGLRGSKGQRALAPDPELTRPAHDARADLDSSGSHMDLRPELLPPDSPKAGTDGDPSESADAQFRSDPRNYLSPAPLNATQAEEAVLRLLARHPEYRRDPDAPYRLRLQRSKLKHDPDEPRARPAAAAAAALKLERDDSAGPIDRGQYPRVQVKEDQDPEPWPAACAAPHQPDPGPDHRHSLLLLELVESTALPKTLHGVLNGRRGTPLYLWLSPRDETLLDALFSEFNLGDSEPSSRTHWQQQLYQRPRRERPTAPGSSLQLSATDLAQWRERLAHEWMESRQVVLHVTVKSVLSERSGPVSRPHLLDCAHHMWLLRLAGLDCAVAQLTLAPRKTQRIEPPPAAQLYRKLLGLKDRCFVPAPPGPASRHDQLQASMMRVLMRQSLQLPSIQAEDELVEFRPHLLAQLHPSFLRLLSVLGFAQSQGQHSISDIHFSPAPAMSHPSSHMSFARPCDYSSASSSASPYCHSHSYSHSQSQFHSDHRHVVVSDQDARGASDISDDTSTGAYACDAQLQPSGVHLRMPVPMPALDPDPDCIPADHGHDSRQSAAGMAMLAAVDLIYSRSALTLGLQAIAGSIQVDGASGRCYSLWPPIVAALQHGTGTGIDTVKYIQVHAEAAAAVRHLLALADNAVQFYAALACLARAMRDHLHRADPAAAEDPSEQRFARQAEAGLAIPVGARPPCKSSSGSKRARTGSFTDHEELEDVDRKPASPAVATAAATYPGPQSNAGAQSLDLQLYAQLTQTGAALQLGMDSLTPHSSSADPGQLAQFIRSLNEQLAALTPDPDLSRPGHRCSGSVMVEDARMQRLMAVAVGPISSTTDRNSMSIASAACSPPNLASRSIRQAHD